MPIDKSRARPIQNDVQRSGWACARKGTVTAWASSVVVGAVERTEHLHWCASLLEQAWVAAGV